MNLPLPGRIPFLLCVYGKIRAFTRATRGREADTIDGWIAYGHALNEGRALFHPDEQFGQWVAENVNTNLVVTPRPEDRLAAMWAAATQPWANLHCSAAPLHNAPYGS